MIFALMLLAYVIGSIPFGLLVGRFWAGIDVRQYGSGNIGTSNVMRTLGTVPAVLVLALDAAKGMIPVLIAREWWGPSVGLLVGLAAIVGHNWPIFLRFRGGRGIATSLGVLLGLVPGIAFTLAVIWALVVVITRYISVGSLVVSVLLPFVLVYTGQPLPVVVGGFAMAVFSVYRHWPNIQRLRRGTEYRVGERVGPGGPRRGWSL